jgi:hypothetical protein
MPERKMARAAQQQQSLASGRRVRRTYHQTTRPALLFATKFRRKTMITAIKLGLVALVLFALAYAVETRAILALESSDKSGAQVYDYVP